MVHPNSNYDQCCDDGRRRAQNIAHHMGRRARQIKIAPVAAMDDPKGRQIDQQSGDGDRQHGIAHDGHRLDDAAHRFDADPADHNDQGQSVDEGGDDLQPVIAVGAFVVRRAPGHAEGDPGKRQRDGIGQHMAGVGEQGQQARDQPARNFHRHENGDDDQRPEDAPLVAVLMMAMVMRHLERLPNPAGRSQEFWRAAG